MAQYRRIQLARYLIDTGTCREQQFGYDDHGCIDHFGLSPDVLDAVIDRGEPFRTSGCEGYDGEVACNRPYANSRPGPHIRNFPFAPTQKDLLRVRAQLDLLDGSEAARLEEDDA